MRTLIGIVNVRRYTVRIFPCKMAEQIFILFFSGTNYHKLCIFCTDFFDYIVNQIKALLVSQSRHNTNHKLLIILWKTKFFLKAALIFNFFFAECSCIIICINKWILCRIILIVVKAIHNSGQTPWLRINQAI